MEMPCEYPKTDILFSLVSVWKVWFVVFLVCGGRWHRLLRTAVCSESAMLGEAQGFLSL